MDLYNTTVAVPRTVRGSAIVASAAALANHGLTTAAAWWRVRRGRLGKGQRNAYLLGDRPPDLLDYVHAALAVCPPGAVVGYHTAAALHGFGIIETDDIHIVIPGGAYVPRRRGIRAHESWLPFAPIVACGVPCTPPERTAIDLARQLRRPLALSIFDAALFADACGIDDLQAEVARQHGLRGIVRVRGLVDLADGRAQCVQESQLRLLVHDAGITGFVPQLPVTDDDGFPRYFLDLGDPRRQVGLEYNGRSHDGRVRYDERRANWLDERGWRVRYFDAFDLYKRPAWLIDRVHVALQGR